MEEVSVSDFVHVLGVVDMASQAEAALVWKVVYSSRLELGQCLELSWAAGVHDPQWRPYIDLEHP